MAHCGSKMNKNKIQAKWGKITPSNKLAAINLVREHGSCMLMGRIDDYWMEFVRESENAFETMGRTHWLSWLKKRIGGQINGNDNRRKTDTPQSA